MTMESDLRSRVVRRVKTEPGEELEGWILDVDEEGAVHLPEAVMKALGIGPGDCVEWHIAGDGLELRRGRV